MKKQRMDHLEPQHVSPTEWFYVERAGLRILAEVEVGVGGGIYKRCASFVLPWRMVFAAIQCKTATFKPKPRRKAMKPAKREAAR